MMMSDALRVRKPPPLCMQSSRRGALGFMATLTVVNPLSTKSALAVVTEEEVAAAAKARAEAVKARVAAEGLAAVEERRRMPVDSEGLRFSVRAPPADAQSPAPQRGQSVRCEYTISVGGFAGEPGAVVVDDSRGFMKPPFALYAGVFTPLLGKPMRGFDLALMEMRAGEKRAIILPPDLAFGLTPPTRLAAAFATLRSPPPADNDNDSAPVDLTKAVFLELQVLELGAEPLIDEDQMNWLAENPL